MRLNHWNLQSTLGRNTGPVSIPFHCRLHYDSIVPVLIHSTVNFASHNTSNLCFQIHSRNQSDTCTGSLLLMNTHLSNSLSNGNVGGKTPPPPPARPTSGPGLLTARTPPPPPARPANKVLRSHDTHHPDTLTHVFIRSLR